MSVKRSLITRILKTKSLMAHTDANLSSGSHVDIPAEKTAAVWYCSHQKLWSGNLFPQQHCIASHLQSLNSTACIVWGNCGTKRADKLEKRPNRAARVLTFADYGAGAWQLFESVIGKILVLSVTSRKP